MPRIHHGTRVPREMVLLIREQVARLNICLFCMDIGRSFAIKEMMNEAKFDALDEYRTSTLFTDAERTALDYVTEVTKEKKSQPGHVCARGSLLFRAGDL